MKCYQLFKRKGDHNLLSCRHYEKRKNLVKYREMFSSPRMPKTVNAGTDFIHNCFLEAISNEK